MPQDCSHRLRAVGKGTSKAMFLCASQEQTQSLARSWGACAPLRREKQQFPKEVRSLSSLTCSAMGFSGLGLDVLMKNLQAPPWAGSTQDLG